MFFFILLFLLFWVWSFILLTVSSDCSASPASSISWLAKFQSHFSLCLIHICDLVLNCCSFYFSELFSLGSIEQLPNKEQNCPSDWWQSKKHEIKYNNLKVDVMVDRRRLTKGHFLLCVVWVLLKLIPGLFSLGNKSFEGLLKEMEAKGAIKCCFTYHCLHWLHSLEIYSISAKNDYLLSPGFPNTFTGLRSHGFRAKHILHNYNCFKIVFYGRLSIYYIRCFEVLYLLFRL